MLIEMTENIGTTHGGYRRGGIYDVAPPLALDWIKAGHAMAAGEAQVQSHAATTAIERMLAEVQRHARPPMTAAELHAATERNEREMLARLDIAAGATGLFFPFIGEVGWLVMWHMRLVHFSKAARKIVCCQRGQECLFPDADEFFYDWKDPLDDINRAGTDRQSRHWPDIRRRFPGAIAIPAGNLSMDQELIPLHIGQRIPIVPRTRRGLTVDVTIGVRQRKFLPAKNYPHWQRIADTLRAKGFTYAVIGSRESSYALDGMTCMSADYGDWCAAIELLQNCKLFIGTDSGGAHLASVANGCPMIVQTVPDTAAATTRCFIDRMRQTTSHPLTHLPADAWNDPTQMIERTLEALQ